MRIVPLEQWHLEKIDAQQEHKYVQAWITPAVKEELAAGMSFAAVDGDKIFGCAGVLEYWPGRMGAWAYLSGDCGRHFVRIHRAVQSFLEMSDYARIEAAAAIGFGPGHRWLELLGFTVETPVMRGYLPNGADATMYVRGVKNG